ncbi:hypothetical protein [Nocardia sp. CY41]|uniref:hypothetical protein n=1 Tax=Nocardia sp. CY41 TaxID=2608686 RepID=UPI0013568051|nr:hypothetical protein [Nocardia sp. CY41]
MSAKPLRIIRVPQTPPGPSTAHLEPENPYPTPTACPRCGAWVADEELHAEFHGNFASMGRWMRRAADLLRQVIREDLPAYDELVPRDGDIKQGDNQ